MFIKVFKLGEGGVTEFVLAWNPITFVTLGAHAKFHEPRTTPFGKKVTRLEEREKNACNVQGQGMHFAGTNTDNFTLQ